QRREVEGTGIAMECDLACASEGIEGGEGLRLVAAVVHEVQLVRWIAGGPANAAHTGLGEPPSIPGGDDQGHARRRGRETVAYVAQTGGQPGENLGGRPGG